MPAVRRRRVTFRAPGALAGQNRAGQVIHDALFDTLEKGASWSGQRFMDCGPAAESAVAERKSDGL